VTRALHRSDFTFATISDPAQHIVKTCGMHGAHSGMKSYCEIGVFNR
jgi:hypothetical protein